MTGLGMVGGIGRLVLCIAALGTMAAVCPESLSTKAPESYPAARLVALDATSAEVLMIDSAFSQLEYVSHRGKPVADLEGTAGPESPRTWRKVEPHPYLSEVLPGVEFYSVVGRQGRREGISGSAGEWLMARRQGQLYKMPEALNQLLYDQGMRFTKADVPKWTRLSALVWAILNRGDLQGEVIGDWDFVDSTYWRLPAVPALTFESVDVETSAKVYSNEHVRVVLDGATVDLNLLVGGTWFGKTENRRLGIIPLWIQDDQTGHRIEMGPMKERSGLDGGIELDVPILGGISYHWYASGSVPDGVYCVVEDQGQATNNVVRFDVRGVQGHDAVYVMLVNMYAEPSVYETLRVKITAGSGTVTWQNLQPGKSSDYRAVLVYKASDNQLYQLDSVVRGPNSPVPGKAVSIEEPIGVVLECVREWPAGNNIKYGFRAHYCKQAFPGYNLDAYVTGVLSQATSDVYTGLVSNHGFAGEFEEGLTGSDPRLDCRFDVYLFSLYYHDKFGLLFHDAGLPACRYATYDPAPTDIWFPPDLEDQAWRYIFPPCLRGYLGRSEQELIMSMFSHEFFHALQRSHCHWWHPLDPLCGSLWFITEGLGPFAQTLMSPNCEMTFAPPFGLTYYTYMAQPMFRPGLRTKGETRDTSHIFQPRAPWRMLGNPRIAHVVAVGFPAQRHPARQQSLPGPL